MTDMLRDPVSDDCPGAREIGFSCPDRYNAASILFDNLDRGNGPRIAIRGPWGQMTYAQLCARAAQAGQGLLSLGLARGDRVLLLLDDGPDYPVFLYGALRAGLVPVMLNTLTPADLLAYYATDSSARAIVLDGGLVDRVTAEVIAGGGLATAIVAGDGVVAGVDSHRAADWLDRFPAALDAAGTGRDDMAFWMYSSGSTGRPKGIVHLHHDMAYTAASFGDRVLRLTPDDVCFSVPKIFFAYGLGNSLTFPFSVGASSVLMPGRPEPEAVFATIAAHRPTVFYGLPTLYTALVQSPAAAGVDFGSLRLCLSAAEVLSAEVAGAWTRLSGLPIVEGLGSTEVLHIYLSNDQAEQRHGSAGRRVPGYEIELRDPDGRLVGDEEEGILWVRGQSNAPFYWNRPDKTAETMRGDWIWTGDRFTRDADGFHYFRGRADDLIKVSGQWVHPLEVELCLAEHPALREVAVLGVELADRRMALRAYVVPRDRGGDTDALAAALRDHVKRTLIPYKAPRLFTVLDELPKTGTGKIDRQGLRKIEDGGEA